EELHPVRVALEHALPLAREAQADAAEELRVAERRRRGQRVAVRRLDQARGSAPERREDAEEPCVAEEGRALERLRGRECRRCRRRARGDRLERTPLGAGEAVTGRRQLLELSAKRGAGERKLRRRTERPRGERRRLGRAKGGPCLRGRGECLGSCNTALRPQRLELLRAQLAEAAERRPARERVDDDQLRRRSDVVRERER